MKILFLTSRLPFPPIGGDKLRTYNFLKYLNKYHEITLMTFVESKKELESVASYSECYDKIITVILPKTISYIKSLRGIFSKKPIQVFYYQSGKMKNTIKNELNNGYDIVFAHLLRMAQYIPENDNIRKIIDFTDAISLNYQRSRYYRKGFFSIINYIESNRLLPYEVKEIIKSDISIFISESDANYLRNIQTTPKLQIIQNGVDLDNLKFNTGSYSGNRICFVGNMRTFPNSDAVLYFVNSVLPLIKSQIPDIQFFIVGVEPSKKIINLHDGKNVFVTGFVESVIPFITKSAVLVAPMRVGAGVQNKILEAMALGTPVVTTSIGAEGLDENKLTIGNTPDEISHKIIELIENKQLRKDKSLMGREYIENNFQWDRVLKELDSYL